MRKLEILFVIDPLETLHAETDTTLVIMAEAVRRGHCIWTATIDNLRIEHGIPYGRLTRITMRHAKQWKTIETRDIPLERIPVILMRKDPPFTIDYVMATSILSLVNPQKSFIINHPTALRTFNEKLGILQFPKFIPHTIVTKIYSDIIHFLKKYRKIVLKPLEGYAGNEIVVLDEKDKNRNVLLEMMTHKEKRYIMAQKYLPEVQKGDKRILILNGEILGQQNRIAAPDDHRSNVSVGGRSRKTCLDPSERHTAELVAKSLLRQGIYFAGIDMIGGFVTEVNVTSPTGLVKINGHEGVHLERKVVDFFERSTFNVQRSTFI